MMGPNQRVQRWARRRMFMGLLLAAMVYGAGLSGCSLSTDNEQVPKVPPAAQKAPATAAQSPSGMTEQNTEQGFGLQDLSAREEHGQTTLSLKFSQPVSEYRHFPLSQPARIILDVFGEPKRLPKAESFRVETNWVAGLRLSSEKGSVRIAVDIAAAKVPPYTISPENGGLKIVIGNIDPNATAKKELTLMKGGKRTDTAAGGLACSSFSESEALQSSTEVQETPEKKYTGQQKISLEFKDADIKNVFRLIGEVSGLNILVTDDVKRKVTIRLVEVPWKQALDLLIDTNGLAEERIGNVLRISTAATIARDKKEQLEARDAARKIARRQTSYINVNYASAKDLVDKVRQIIKSSPDFAIVPDAIVSDERSNTIVVHGTGKDVQDIACIVSRLDVRTPQVLIESNLVETTPTFARSLGINMDTFFNKGRVQTSTRFTADTPFSGPSISFNPEGVPIPTPASGFLFGYFGNNIAAALSAAENEGLVKIISRPSVVTLNGVPSKITSERILRIALPSSTNIASGSGAAAGTAVATQEVPIGIELTVRPQVSSDGFILMNVKVKSSSIANSPTVSGGTAGVIPFDELNREAEANVLVRDGETIVIGGILKDTGQESESGVPYLKDIPVLGWLFKNHTWQKDFEELVVFVTPRIASAGSENLPSADQLWREQMKKTSGGQPVGGLGQP
jgi:type IV pilus assembly protein PilQ